MDPELLKELERIAIDLNRLVGASTAAPKEPVDAESEKFVQETYGFSLSDGVVVQQRPQAYSAQGGNGTISVLDIVKRVAGDTALTMRSAGIGDFAVMPGEERIASLQGISYGADFLLSVASDFMEFDPDRTDTGVIGRLPISDQVRVLAVRDHSRIAQAFPGTPTRKSRFDATVDAMEAAGMLSPESARAIRLAGTQPFLQLPPDVQQAAAQDIDAINAALPAITDAAMRDVSARGRAESADPQQNRFADVVSGLASGDGFLAGRSPFPRLAPSTQAQAAGDRRNGEMRTFVEDGDGKSLVEKALLDKGISASTAAETDPDKGAAHSKAVSQLEADTAKYIAELEAMGLSPDDITDAVIDYLGQVTAPEAFGTLVDMNARIRADREQADEEAAAQKSPKSDVDRMLRERGLLPEDVTKADYIALQNARAGMTGDEFAAALDASLDTIVGNKQTEVANEEAEKAQEQADADAAKLKTPTGAAAAVKQALFDAGISEDALPTGAADAFAQTVSRQGPEALAARRRAEGRGGVPDHHTARRGEQELRGSG